MTATLSIFRGLPGSGKTTEAKRRVATARPGGVFRLNRDALRRMGLPDGYGKPEPEWEELVSDAQHAALAALLAAGCDVICDDTNLNPRHVRTLMEIATKAGATVEFVDFTHVPLEHCVLRDALRRGPERVGAEVIQNMHARYLAPLNGGPLPVPELAPEGGA